MVIPAFKALWIVLQGKKGCFLWGCLFGRGRYLSIFISSSLANEIKLISHLEREKSGLCNVCVFSWVEVGSLCISFSDSVSIVGKDFRKPG